VFERGNDRLSNRGYGTETRTDPVFLSLHKTRLLDPGLWFIGSADHPGDYRSSGCTGCHVIYANDRDPVHSAAYAQYGNEGKSATADAAIPKDVSGFPIRHEMTTAIPSSQCVVCHVHPGTNVLNSYFGTIWWDNESDGELMYPKQQKYPTAEEFTRSNMSNPDETAARGNWSDPAFLERVAELNKEIELLRGLAQKSIQQSLLVKVIEFGDKGAIHYNDPARAEQPVTPLPDAKTAHALIEEQRKEAQGRNVYYQFLRRYGQYPTVGQVRMYREWFKGVPNSLEVQP